MAVVDQPKLLKSLVAFVRKALSKPDLTADNITDAQVLSRLLSQIDAEYFQPALVSIAKDPNGSHGWVHHAALLKRVYLRLLGHYSFALGLDPSRLPVPDCNLVARRGAGWEAHLIRLMALILYALFKTQPPCRCLIEIDDTLHPWIQSIDEKLNKDSGFAPIALEEFPEFAGSPENMASPLVRVAEHETAAQVSVTEHEEVSTASLYPAIEPVPKPKKQQEKAIEELSSLVSRLQEQLAQTKAELEAQKKDCQQLSAQLADEQKEAEKRESLLNDLKDEIDRGRSETADEMNYIEEIAVLEIELDSVRARLQQEMARRAQLEAQLEADTGAEAFEAERVALERRLSQVMLVNEELQKESIEKGGYEEELAEKLREIQQLQNQNALLTGQAEELVALKEELANLRTQNDQLQKMNSDLTRAHEADLARLQLALEQSRSTAESKEEEESGKIIELQAMLAEEQTRAQTHAESVVALEKMIESMDAELMQTQELLQTTSRRVEELEQLKQGEDVLERMRGLDESLADSCRLVEELQAKEISLTRTVKELEEQLAAASKNQDRIATLEAQLKDAQLNIGVLEQERSSPGTEKQLEKTIAEKNRQIGDLEEILGQLEEDLAAQQLETTALVQQVKDMQAEKERVEADLTLRMNELIKINQEQAENLNLVSDTNLNDIARMAAENRDKLALLAELQSKIDETTSAMDALKITPLEDRIRNLEGALKATEETLKSAHKTEAALKNEIVKPDAQHKMILAAWHALGTRIMKDQVN